MSKTKKIAILAIIAMVLTMLPVQLFAAVNVSADRLYGDNRVETALAVCEAGWPTSAREVVLAPANQENLVDALAASSLAGQEDAPILLTDKNALDPLVKAKLVDLGTDIVYVVGAISDSVFLEVEAMAEIDAIQLKGNDRWETTKKINDMLTKPNGCFVVGYNALPDALSASSYAAANGYAIILADTTGNIPAGQKELGSKTYILGGPALVEHIPGSTRIYGSDRYATNAEFAKFFMNTHGGMKAANPYQKVYVANGDTSHLVDSLVVSPLAGRQDAFIFLSRGGTAAPEAAANIPEGVNLVPVALGGTGVVSEAARTGATNNDNQAVTAFEVTNVVVESLTDVKVTFSQPVDETAAEHARNFIFNGDILTGYDGATDNTPRSVAIMQADKKSVVVILDPPKAQNQSRIFEVRGGYVSQEGKDQSTAPHYTKDLTFADTSAPVVSEVKVIGTKKIKVTFNESVLVHSAGSGAAVTINNGVLTLDPNDFIDWKIDDDRISNRNLASVTCAASETSRRAADYYTRSVTLTFNDAIGNGEHQLTIPAGSTNTNILSDAARFYHAKEVKDFTVQTFTGAPVVQSVTYDKGDVIVKFDRAMEFAPTANSNYTYSAINPVNYGINSSTLNTGMGVPSLKADDTEVKITGITAAGNIVSGTNFITIDKDLKDAWGNKLHGSYDQRYNFTVELDKTRPTVEQVTCLDTATLRVHFSEKVRRAEAGDLSNYKITDSNGAPVAITSAISVPRNSANNDNIDSDTWDLTFAPMTLTESNYTLTVKGIVDMFANIMNDYSTTFNGIDDVGPEVINADSTNATGPDAVLSAIDGTCAVLFFDTALDITSATTLANYQYTDENNEFRALPLDTVVRLDITGKIVTVDFPTGYYLDPRPATDRHGKYTVRQIVVSGVKDKAGNVMKGMASTCELVTTANVNNANLNLTFTNDTFALYDDGDFVNAEVILNHEPKNFNIGNFRLASWNDTDNDGVIDHADVDGDGTIGGPGETELAMGTALTPDTGYRSGKKITLVFSTNADAVRGYGVNAALCLDPVIANLSDTTTNDTLNDAGLPLMATSAQAVYDERVKPKWVANGVVADDDYNLTGSGGLDYNEAITLEFTENIDPTIRGNYLDDFYFLVGSTYAVPDSCEVTTNRITFYNFKTTTGRAFDTPDFQNCTVTVKAKETSDIRDLKDNYGDYNVFVPTSGQKTTGYSDAVE